MKQDSNGPDNSRCKKKKLYKNKYKGCSERIASYFIMLAHNARASSRG